MKFNVFKKKKKEKEVTFNLHADSNGYNSVILYACDKDGYQEWRGAILSITENGELYLPKNINPSLGLQLDKQGRIKINNARRD